MVGCKKTEEEVDWTKCNLNAGVELDKIFFIDANNGFVACQRPYQAIHVIDSIPVTEIIDSRDNLIFYEYKIENLETDVKTVLFKTTDGGLNWIEMNGLFITGIKDMYFRDVLNGYVLTNFEGSYSTDDGGETWKKILPSKILVKNGFLSNISDKIYFRNPDTGYVYSNNIEAVIYTENGGENWDLYSYFNTNSKFNDAVSELYFINNGNTGFVRTVHDGNIFKTTDGGENWIKLFERSKSTSFLNSTTGFCITNEEIYKTNDSGETWNFVENIFYYKISPEPKISAKSAKSIFLTSFGFVYQSFDGGLTFQLTKGLDENSVTNTFFPDSVTGFAITKEGSVYKYQK